jgi:uncharacterized membrane protein
MLKRTFLKKLQTKLVGLDESKVKSIMTNYEKIIDDEIEAGEKEEKVVASLGDIDMIAKIYNHKENFETNNDDTPNKETLGSKSKEKKDNINVDDMSNNIINNILTFINDSFKSINGDLAKRILLLLSFIAAGILIIVLFHIPFRILDIAGSTIFWAVFNDYNFYKIISSLWAFSLNIAYAVLIIIFIVKYIEAIVKQYSIIDLKKHENNKIEKEIKPEAKVVKDTTTSDTIYLILKVFIIILTIPLLMVEVGLFIALFFGLSLVVSGVLLFGPIIFLVGLMIMIATFLNLIYSTLSKGGIR